ESLTALGLPSSAWSYSPETLKPTADLALAHGLNRFVIHTSVHQPVDDKIPGLGLGPFGQWFTRHETWAEYAKVWTDYLSRSSYLLQQGKFVADIVYYYGEDNNITGLFGKVMPSIPEGYNFDFINADALTNLLSFKDGKLVTPSGMSYQVLVLDNNAKKMSLPVLKKLGALVKSGAVLIGSKPEATPSLSDDQNEFAELVNEIWNSANQKVFKDKPLNEALSSLGIAQDFTYSKPQANTKFLYLHRRSPNLDIYWINNRNGQEENVDVNVRIDGKVPELWHPETGKREPVSYSITNGITKVRLHLAPYDAVFLIFRSTATQPAVTLTSADEKTLATVGGNWKVNFQKDRGAPSEVTLNNLASFTESQEPGIKYFSGTATYTKTITAANNWIGVKDQLWLDLGDVKNIAEVKVNGKLLGVVWKRPFRVDISNALRAGDNLIEIEVTNLWVNRLIGDQQPNVTKKITYTTMPFYQANSPLFPSGLLGPVKILSVQ
ncbi:MAG TPA: glycosyl hydrolase, partial [Chryseolinea sp.]|nr:glycosyl hydrolase [Chryseolinea sp.]